MAKERKKALEEKKAKEMEAQGGATGVSGPGNSNVQAQANNVTTLNSMVVSVSINGPGTHTRALAYSLHARPT